MYNKQIEISANILEEVMARRKQWVFDPDLGGVKIPDAVKRDVEQQINRVAEENFKGKYTRLDIRFRGQFCIDMAYGRTSLECATGSKQFDTSRLLAAMPTTEHFPAQSCYLREKFLSCIAKTISADSQRTGRNQHGKEWRNNA